MLMVNNPPENSKPEEYQTHITKTAQASFVSYVTTAIEELVAVRAQEQLQKEQNLATQLEVPDEQLPEGDGWERTALPDDVYANLKQGNGLAIFVRAAEEGFGYDTQAVLMINQGDVDAYRTFSIEQLATAASLSDEKKPYSIVVDADNITHDAANADEGAGYMITIAGDVLGAGITPELLHKELGEHFAPLVGEAVEFEIMLRLADKELAQDTLQTPNMSNDIEPRIR